MGTRPALPYGLILAGGQSRRMGGGDKVLHPLPGGSALSILMGRMAKQCSGLAISVNGDPERFAAFSVPLLADSIGPQAGPLAGVLSGLDYIATKPHADWLLTVAGDTPFIPLDLTARLAEAAKAQTRLIARSRSAGRDHGLVALWSVALRDRLRAALIGRDLRKVMAFQDEIGTAEATWPTAPFDPFFNINTPADLSQAEAIAVSLQNATQA